MKFGFIAKHRGIWPAAWLCEALGVSREWILCLADAAAKPSRSPRRGAGDQGPGELPPERPDLRRETGLA